MAKLALSGLSSKIPPPDLSLARAEGLSQKSMPPIPDIPLTISKNTGGSWQPGLIVCTPAVEAGANADEEAFSAGCGEWLELIAAGQPLMGQSPLLSSIARAQRERKFPDLRLAPAQALDLASATGATHVATATVAPSVPGRPMSMTYTVYQVDTGQPVGQPLALSGTREQILAGLPKLAADIARRTGVSAPEIPSTAGLDPTQMATCGHFSLGRAISHSDLGFVECYAGSSPLPGILALTDTSRGEMTNKGTADRLLTRCAPGNPLVWGAVAFTNAYNAVPHRSALLALRKSYPKNYALAHAAVYTDRSSGDRGEVMAASIALIQNAPRNPEAYLSLAGTIIIEAQNIRRSRTFDRIPENERPFLDKAYVMAEIADLHCVEIDPAHETAWERLMESATFASDGDVARKAYAPAVKYTKSLASVYGWALEMFQEKWDGTPAELSQAAQDAANAEYSDAGEAAQVAALLHSLNFERESSSLLKRYLEIANSRIEKNNGDGQAHWDRAILIQATGQNNQALGEYRKAVARIPDNNDLWYHYAAVCKDSNQLDEASKAYRHVLSADPDQANALIGLGYVLQKSGRFDQIDEAEAVLKKGLLYAPNDKAAHQALGDIHFQRSQWTAAADEYRQSIRLGNEEADCYINLTVSLTKANNATEAVRWGEEAVGLFTREEQSSDQAQYAGDYSAIHEALARAYFKSGRLQEAFQQDETALTLQPQNMAAQENLAMICNSLHHRNKARSLWQSVVANPVDISLSDLMEAKTMLAKYPENGT